jgi:NADPH:quinone reductase-like Zn-dependent oxidoreductase
VRIVRFHAYGGPEVLRVEDQPVPDPGPGQLLVAVSTVGVSFPVVQQTRGGVSLPAAPSGEVAGRVAAVGPDVTRWAVGDRVAGLALEGAYAECALVPAALGGAVPMSTEAVPDDAAVILVRAGQVALGVTRAVPIGDADTVLVTGAAGGVGHLLVQLARTAGAGRVVGAVSAARKAGFARSLGVDAVTTYAELAGPYDVVLDGVGGDMAAAALAALADGGRFVAYSGCGTTVDVNDLRAHAQTATGFAMAQLARRCDGTYQRHQRELLDLAAARWLLPVPHAFPLAEASATHAAILDRTNQGKVVLRV